MTRSDDGNQYTLLPRSPAPTVPIIYLSYTEGAFTRDALDEIAVQLTQDATELEKLAPNDWVRSTTLIYTQAYPQHQVYHGGKPGGSKFITLDVKCHPRRVQRQHKDGDYQTYDRSHCKYGDLPKGEPRRVYVIIRDVAEANLGSDGKSVDLEVLRDPPAGLEPL